MAVANLQADSADLQANARAFLNTFRCNLGTTPFMALDMPDQATILTANAKAIIWLLAAAFQEANATGVNDLRGEIVGEALNCAATLLSLAEFSAHLAQGHAGP